MTAPEYRRVKNNKRWNSPQAPILWLILREGVGGCGVFFTIFFCIFFYFVIPLAVLLIYNKKSSLWLKIFQEYQNTSKLKIIYSFLNSHFSPGNVKECSLYRFISSLAVIVNVKKIRTSTQAVRVIKSSYQATRASTLLARCSSYAIIIFFLLSRSCKI